MLGKKNDPKVTPEVVANYCRQRLDAVLKKKKLAADGYDKDGNAVTLDKSREYFNRADGQAAAFGQVLKLIEPDIEERSE